MGRASSLSRAGPTEVVGKGVNGIVIFCSRRPLAVSARRRVAQPCLRRGAWGAGREAGTGQKADGLKTPFSVLFAFLLSAMAVATAEARRRRS